MVLLASPIVDNPLREGLRMRRTAEPCAVVIFGVTGDLAHRKLLPALYNLMIERRLPVGFSLVGFARRPFSDEEFREQARESIEKYSRNKPSPRPSVWENFAQGLFYVQSNFDDANGYAKLASKLEEIDRERGTMGNRIYYLSTPPDFYAPIVANLGASGLANTRLMPSGNGSNTAVLNTGMLMPPPADDAPWRRIIIEKPFGHDLPSAQQLNRQISEVFTEEQIYRIDHYLGKETVQNILVFRFANGIWEPLWSRRYIDNVQITVAESLGVEDRASYYDHAGALRDMLQNHMMQLLTLVAMEPPASFDAQAVRDEKAKVLRAIKPFSTAAEVAKNTVRGQYGPGAIFGKPVPAYHQEEGVPPDSITETFVAARFFVENWRWSGVPFYLRHGKRLPKRDTEIAIQFKPAPLALFQHTAADELLPNSLVLHIQPDEGIALRFESKTPGPEMRLRSVDMNFRYGTSFGVEPADAYERLLMDCMLGDSTLFTRRDEVELMWQLATSILEGWKQIPPPTFPNYRAGSWGPMAADNIIVPDGRTWRRL
ncbi:MAG TPA: glucose-6-phosphate dehydrogenase [Chloroflexia bacterium]|nr:glucose-6-phosphate dehydrogenase [Chloroflexia bacterium]